VLVEAQVTCASVHKQNGKFSPLKLSVQALGVCVYRRRSGFGFVYVYRLRLDFGYCVHVGAHLIRSCKLHVVSVGNWHFMSQVYVYSMSVTHSNIKIFVLQATSWDSAFQPSSGLIQEQRYRRTLKLQFRMEISLHKKALQIYITI
jgi:hypothetical protein